MKHKKHQPTRKKHIQTILISSHGEGFELSGKNGLVLSIIASVLFGALVLAPKLFCFPLLPLLGCIAWTLGLMLSFVGTFHAPRGCALGGLVISLINLSVLFFWIGCNLSGVIGLDCPQFDTK